MRRVNVALPQASYDVWVGKGLCQRLPQALAQLQPTAVAVIGDRVLDERAQTLCQSLARRGVPATALTLPVTESAKDYRRLFSIFGELIAAKLDRQSIIVALGGGVIGDLAGFVAATYLRGIRWVGVPTTLLAQVDSSVGGKTGVNHPLGKNLIGAFHQPCLVVADVALLHSLSLRDRISGYGEMVKYGLAYDPRLLRQLVRRRRQVLALRSPLIEACIAASVRHKARVVAADPYETLGMRRVLNLGHTVAHALETLAGYGKLRHGEAVLYGLRAALSLSVVRGHLSAGVQATWEAALADIPLPPLPRLSLTRLWHTMLHDKKAQAGKVNFVLLQAIGKPVVDPNVGPEDVAAAFVRLGWRLSR